MAEIGPIASNLRGYRFTGFGMDADFAWQRKQFDGPFQPKIFRRNILGDRRPLGFLAFAFFHIRTKTAHLSGDFLVAVRIDAQFLRPFILFGIGPSPLREAPGELAFGIVGTGDKGAEATAAQGQLAFVAAWAQSGVAAVFLFGK